MGINKRINAIGKITSNEHIPMNNLFNRTSFFIPLQLRERNEKIKEGKPYIFNDGKHYSLEMHGSKLNHTIDYPLLALIIKHWLNARDENGEFINTIQMDLSDINELIKPSTKGGKKSEKQDKIKASLIRLCSSVVCFESPSGRSDEMSPVLSFAKLDYKNKCVKVEVSRLLIKLYNDKTKIFRSDFKYMNIEKIYKAPSETSKALMKYFMTQDKRFIDFKLARLENVLGYQFKEKPLKPKVIRKNIINALDELVECKFLTVYKPEEVPVNKGWEQIRIIPASLCKDLEKAKGLLKTMESNYALIKQHHTLNILNDEVPF